MFRLKKIHKYAGVLSGIVLIFLCVSGFFLNHDNWKFLYTTTLPNNILPQATIDKEKRLYNAYYIDKEDDSHKLFCGFKGIEIFKDAVHSYKKTLDIPCYCVVASSRYYSATTDGIYVSDDKGVSWKPFALQGKIITSLSLDKKKLLAVIDKKVLVLLDIYANILHKGGVKLKKEELIHDISLSRLVRDIHYGRGLFDDGFSLLWNDFSSLWLMLLATTGYGLWYMIGKIRYSKRYKKPLSLLFKIHKSFWVLIAVIPLILLGITGIFLDHSNFFGQFLHQTKISHKLLPPVYHTLKEDIWSADIHDGVYRIGNRYGVYESEDLQSWHLENRGFAYKIMHDNGNIYVSGMGSKNRVLQQNRWKILNNTPHMFKSIYTENGVQKYFSSSTHDLTLPVSSHTTLYSFLLSIHDGTFFASWWVFVNDIASVLLLLLLYTGLCLWYKHIIKNNNLKVVMQNKN